MKYLIACLVMTLACSGAMAQDKWCDATDVKVTSAHVTGIQSLPESEQKAVPKQLIGVCFYGDERPADYVLDVLRQNGYWKAEVSNANVVVVDKSARPRSGRLDAHVVPGVKYSIQGIEVRGIKAFTMPQVRDVMAIRAGEPFNIERVRQAITSLKALYGEFGYINFTPIPDIVADDSSRTVQVIVDVDEGSQYRVGNVAIRAPTDAIYVLAAEFPLRKGDIYDPAKLERFFEENKPLMPTGATPDRNVEIDMNNVEKTVAIKLKLCPPGYVCLP